MMVNIYWLVVSTPLKNISHSFALSRNVEATAALCSGRSNCPKLLAEHLHRKEKPAKRSSSHLSQIGSLACNRQKLPQPTINGLCSFQRRSDRGSRGPEGNVTTWQY